MAALTDAGTRAESTATSASRPPSLIDAHGRVVRDLRLSVTPRCNFRCTYCDPMGMGAHEPPGTLLAEHFDVILQAAAGLGMESVRFTGGEPLLRKDLPELIAIADAAFAAHAVEHGAAGAEASGAGASGAKASGRADIAITTNASGLAQRLPSLLDAGLRRVNISFDAVDPDVFRLATGGGDIRQVWRGIEAVEAAGLTPLKLNAVVVRGVNDSQVAGLAGLTRDWH